MTVLYPNLFFNDFLFVCVDSLRPSQHFFQSCLDRFPVLNQY